MAARGGPAAGLCRESAAATVTDTRAPQRDHAEDVKDFRVPDLGEGLEDATITSLGCRRRRSC